jgi:hypothetical protein
MWPWGNPIVLPVFFVRIRRAPSALFTRGGRGVNPMLALRTIENHFRAIKNIELTKALSKTSALSMGWVFRQNE